MKFHAIILSIALSASLPAGAEGISDILSQIAEHNPSLRGAAAANEAEIMEMRGDNTLPPTSIEYSPFFRGGISGVASSELVVSQEFDFPTLYASRQRQADLQSRGLDLSVAAQRREILREAQSSLLDLILLQKEREILDSRMKDTSALLQAYEQSLKLGKATILEVNKVKLELQDLRREILQNDADRARAVSLLQALNGNQPLDLTGIDYDTPAEMLPAITDPEALLGADTAVAAAEAEIETARHGVSLAKSGWLPSLTLGYRRNTEEKEAVNGFIVGAALPIFTNSVKTRAAQARLNAASMQLESTRIEAANALDSELQQLQLSMATLSTYDLSLMTETLQLYRKSLDAGQITLTEYYTETSQLYDRLLTRARLENTIQQNYARILSTGW